MDGNFERILRCVGSGIYFVRGGGLELNFCIDNDVHFATANSLYLLSSIVSHIGVSNNWTLFF